MPDDAARVKSLFLAASEIIDPSQRSAFLDRECDGKASLRQQIEILLEANDEFSIDVDVTEDGSGPMPEQNSVDPTAQVGSVLAGKYKLVEEIGAGGMGSVFMAQQTEPVFRAVAVKVVKAGMDSHAVLARFEVERQALAMMDHPNIAKVYDAGTTAGGRPFFVMELVEGVPITEYCDARRLTPRKRLELIIPVCQAIQHAHQKGIIHRDIKPSNVLVAMYDDHAVPKVIDFGVAKATDASLTDKSLMTGFGAVVGTPEYMSPEQAQLNNLDIDSRSDVYSLGVLLYELLTGVTPVDRTSLQEAALLEILRIVREVDAPRPSAKLSSIDTLANVAANRNTEPAGLLKLMAGDLDWVLLKALEKDRSRRYETANAFARDVQRFLANETVEAHPPSTTYRLKKFIRRHRLHVISASLVVIALVAGIVGTSIGFFRAEGQRMIAEQKREEAEAQRLRAEAGEELAESRLVLVEAEKKKTEEERKIAQAVKDFLQTHLLAQADIRTQATGLLHLGRSANDTVRDPTIGELLATASEHLAPDRIETKFPNQPRVQAEILRTVGDSYLAIGQTNRAIELLKRSVEILKAKLALDHPETLKSMHHLSRMYLYAGKSEMGRLLAEQTLAVCKTKLSPDHPAALASMYNLALAHQQLGILDVARRLAEELLQHKKANKANDEADLLIAMSLLASIYTDLGLHARAIPLAEEVLRKSESLLGTEHPDTLAAMNALAVDYLMAGNPAAALPLLVKALNPTESRFGPNHPATLACMANLAGAYRKLGKNELALPLQKKALDSTKATHGVDHPSTLTNMNNLAVAYWSAKQFDKAIELFEDLLPIQQRKMGRDHPVVQGTVANLGTNYLEAGQFKRAIPLLEEAYRTSKTLPPLAWVERRLFSAYAQDGQIGRADRVLEEVRSRIPKASPQLVGVLPSFSEALLKAKAYNRAETLLRELLTLGDALQLPEWTRFNTKSMLGEALLGQKKYRDAEDLLLKSFDGLKQHENQIPQTSRAKRMRAAIQRLVKLYEAIDKQGEATKWKQRLEQPGIDQNK